MTLEYIPFARKPIPSFNPPTFLKNRPWKNIFKSVRNTPLPAIPSSNERPPPSLNERHPLALNGRPPSSRPSDLSEVRPAGFGDIRDTRDPPKYDHVVGQHNPRPTGPDPRLNPPPGRDHDVYDHIIRNPAQRPPDNRDPRQGYGTRPNGEEQRNKYPLNSFDQRNGPYPGGRGVYQDSENTYHKPWAHKNYDEYMYNKNRDSECYNPLTTISNAIVHALESFFYWLGYHIGKYPVVPIVITILLVLGLGSGVHRLNQETDGSKLWVPANSQAQQDLQNVRKWFPQRIRPNVFIVEAVNVLSRECIGEMADIEELVLEIFQNESTHFSELCLRVGPDCGKSHILQLWNYDVAVVRTLTNEQIIATIDAEIKSNAMFNVDNYLAGIQRNASGVITGAEAARMFYPLKASPQLDNETEQANDWEGEFLKIGEMEWIHTTVYRNAFRSQQDEGGGAIFGDVILLSSGYGILIIFVVVVLGRFNRIEHKFYISLVGISCVIFALAVSVGLGAYTNIIFSPLNQILPFLLLGLGVDDMFVIVGALENLPTALKGASIPERMGETMRSAGVSITITSLTDMLAFGIGAITTIPALQSFSAYCLIGILFTFIFQSTYFLAWLSIDERRADDHKDACFFCFRIKKWEPSICSSRLLAKGFFRKFYSKFITMLPIKIFVLVAAGGLLAFGIYGTIHLEQDSDWTRFLPADSYATEYLEKANQYFPSATPRIDGTINIGEIDYHAHFLTLVELHANLEMNEWVESDSVDTWWNSYNDFLQQATDGAVIVRLNATTRIPSTTADFYTILFDVFLTSAAGQRYQNQIGKSSLNTILYSRGDFRHMNLTNSKERIEAMDSVRDTVRESLNGSGITRDQAFAFSQNYISNEGNRAIQSELYRNIGLAFLAVAVMTLILIADFITSFFICLCVILTVLDVGGLMFFWDLDIDTVTSIILILAMGLSIDFSAHIGHTFMTTKGSREERVQRTLVLIGPAVFFGGFSTFLAFILLIASKSYVFQVFFKVFLGVVSFGLFHGLAFLPVVLSILGPRPYKTAHHDTLEDADEDIGRRGWNEKAVPPGFFNDVRNAYGYPPPRDVERAPSGNSGDTGVYSAGDLFRSRLYEEQQRARQGGGGGGYQGGGGPGGAPQSRPNGDYIPRATAYSSGGRMNDGPLGRGTRGGFSSRYVPQQFGQQFGRPPSGHPPRYMGNMGRPSYQQAGPPGGNSRPYIHR